MMMNNPLITFVACSHNEESWNQVFIDSILGQTNQNFKAIVWNNGPYHNDKRIISIISDDSRLVYKRSDIDTGNYGTTNRQQAITECDTEYIIQTSVQDYFLPQAVKYILKGLESKPDILIFNSINHLIAPCQVLDAQLAWSKLDWGNFCIKTSIAKQVGINHGEQYCADWLFIKDCLDRKLIKTAKKLDVILTIHN